MGKSIDTVIKLLIGKPLVLKEESDPARKFIGCKGQDLAYIHGVLLNFPNLAYGLAHSVYERKDWEKEDNRHC